MIVSTKDLTKGTLNAYFTCFVLYPDFYLKQPFGF